MTSPAVCRSGRQDKKFFMQQGEVQNAAVQLVLPFMLAILCRESPPGPLLFQVLRSRLETASEQISRTAATVHMFVAGWPSQLTLHMT